MPHLVVGAANRCTIACAEACSPRSSMSPAARESPKPGLRRRECGRAGSFASRRQSALWRRIAAAGRWRRGHRRDRACCAGPRRGGTAPRPASRARRRRARRRGISVDDLLESVAPADSRRRSARAPTSIERVAGSVGDPAGGASCARSAHVALRRQRAGCQQRHRRREEKIFSSSIPQEPAGKFRAGRVLRSLLITPRLLIDCSMRSSSSGLFVPRRGRIARSARSRGRDRPADASSRGPSVTGDASSIRVVLNSSRDQPAIIGSSSPRRAEDAKRT